VAEKLGSRLMTQGSGQKNQGQNSLRPCAFRLIPYASLFLWVSFRSQLRGSGGFAPPSLASLRYVC
jgi:hypothetical protein